MEVDGDIFDYLPFILRNRMIYHGRVYIDAKNWKDFVITGGQKPVLYETHGKNILSSFQLNNSVFKDVELPTSMLSEYSSYKKKIKELYLFLQIENCLAILSRLDNQLISLREFRDILECNISDQHCSGEPNIEIVYQNGPSDCFELSSLSYLNKGIDLRCNGSQQFEKITRTLRDHVSKASSTLAEINIEIRKEIDEYKKSCQSIDSNSSEDINILSRYGDYWVRSVNGHVLIGIPVYNCSTSKHLIEKIRAVVFASNRTQFIYTQKIFGFQTENETIDPLKLREIYEQDDENELHESHDDDKQQDLVFNHEWIQQKKCVLMPDNAAVIIIKMDFKDFEVASNGCDFNIFVEYNVFLESGTWKELQTHIATVTIDTDIFHARRYALNFESNNVYRDLLAVISSTERQMFRFKFGEDVLMSQLHDFLLRQLLFENIPTTFSVEDEFKFSLSQNMNNTTSVKWFDEDHQIFYCPQDGYWNGTMIRIRTINETDQNDLTEIYEMKIYNKDETKIKNLISTFQNEFGRKISIEPITCCNRSALGVELKYQFREELNSFEELATNLKYKTNKVQTCYQKYLKSQYKPDSVWSEMIKSKSK